MTEVFDDPAEGGARSGRAMRTNPLLADVGDANGLPGSERASVSEAPPNGSPDPEPRPPRASGPEPSPAAPAASPPTPSHGAVCSIGMCPICTLVTAFGDVRPELTEHLLLAGREILLALKVLIDARLQSEDAPPPPAPAGGLEHIAID